MRQDARKKTNNLTPVAHDVIKIILGDPLFWRHLEQIVNTVKFIVDAIGNLESCQASLADCMLELLRCAKQMSQLTFDDDYDIDFWRHAKSVFNR